MNRKIIALILTLLFVLGITINSYAASNEYADKLNKLGLFLGTENGYELDKPLTREQSAVMLVRLLGVEQKVKEQIYSEVFVDVPYNRWSFNYVMYCYDNKITNGTGADTFTPESNITAAEYVTLVLRLLGYTDVQPETAFDEGVRKYLFNSQRAKEIENKQQFLREDMVYITYRSLSAKNSDGKILARALADSGVLTNKQADEFDIYSSGDLDDILDKLFE